MLTKDEIAHRWPDVVQSFPDINAAYEEMGKNVDALRSTTRAYYRWIAAALKPWLGLKAMEVGAGPGFLSAHIAGLDYYLISENWSPFLSQLIELTAKRPEVDIRKLDISELNDKRDELRSLDLDSIFSTNVLEHIKDDVEAMRTMASVVRPGGRVINFVPAYRYLYGNSDRVIGHFRRYEREEMRAKMVAAGLVVEKVMTFNQAGVFSWMFVNKVLRRSSATGGQFATFDKFVPLFRVWETLVPIPVGLSLVGIGRTRH
jgi:2-polyprenyl-3-methyl-5-hydroxy-6-metoxy-1,4-benzoquinol methylase